MAGSTAFVGIEVDDDTDMDSSEEEVDADGRGRSETGSDSDDEGGGEGMDAMQGMSELRDLGASVPHNFLEMSGAMRAAVVEEARKSHMERLKERGNALYKAGRWEDALRAYREAAASPHADPAKVPAVLSNISAVHFTLADKCKDQFWATVNQEAIQSVAGQRVVPSMASFPESAAGAMVDCRVNLAEVARLCEAALEKLDATGGGNNALALKVLVRGGRAQLRLANWSEAEAMLARAVELDSEGEAQKWLTHVAKGRLGAQEAETLDGILRMRASGTAGTSSTVSLDAEQAERMDKIGAGLAARADTHPYALVAHAQGIAFRPGRSLADRKRSGRLADAAVAAAEKLVPPKIIAAARSAAEEHLDSDDDDDVEEVGTSLAAQVAYNALPPYAKSHGELPLKVDGLFLSLGFVKYLAGDVKGCRLAWERYAEDNPLSSWTGVQIERLGNIERSHSDGNSAFKVKRFQKAYDKYCEALSCLSADQVELKAALLCNRAACYHRLGQLDEGLSDANEALRIQPNFPKGRIRRAEISIDCGKAATAIYDYQHLLKMAETKDEKKTYEERLKYCKISLVRERRGDHYKTLGVSRDVSADELTKAFRKLALKFHPDKVGAGSTAHEKQMAEKRFKDITEAHDVLSNALEKRKYDMKLGIDELQEAGYQPSQAEVNRYRQAEYESQAAAHGNGHGRGHGHGWGGW